ncbi:MAG: sulfotransferase domain-containing protein [Candidatus Marinimicrobia bacterium]|nr:sulfotransferase domain-containing protein [Candidatus Neomarinimicrobiota bacterium]
MPSHVPNFFIIGAPKCGTTSLSIYLDNHPDILMSTPKEPHYFSDDIENGRVKTMQEYLDCFVSEKKSYKAIGEASTLYLYSQVAIKNIIKFNPNAKFIVQLRNPIEVVFSFHQLALKIFGETEISFEKSWELMQSRNNGKNIPSGCPDVKLLLYGEIAKFGSQVEKLQSLVNDENIHFVFFDEFATNTNDVFENVLSFLNIKKTPGVSFEIHNKTRRIKYPFITKLTNVALAWKKAVGIKSEFGLANKIHAKNITNDSPAKLNSETVKMLVGYFNNDIKKLSDLLNRDFSKWSLK